LIFSREAHKEGVYSSLGFEIIMIRVVCVEECPEALVVDLVEGKGC